ncbi:MAG: 16S rRNA (guanine(527)-N(7))-methyltransferase RsmG [Ignavibacteriales bacterium]
MDRPGWIGLLERSASEAGFRLTEEQMRAFRVFRDELLSWNTRINLTSLTEDEDVVIKHFVDSLLCLRGLEPGGGQERDGVAGGHPGWSSLVDVGSGGGFPGIPLAIVRPRARVWLLESVRKKCEFLESVVRALGLEAAVVWKRAEDAGRDPSLREMFDAVVSRAVAAMPVLAEYCLPLCRVGGVVVAMKGPEGGPEADHAQEAIGALGGRISRVDEYELPWGMGKRSLVVIDKVRAVPGRYPRKAGIPAKKPLGGICERVT